MMLGTMFCNLCDFSAELMERVDRWTAPLFALFFVISGAELELSVFAKASSSCPSAWCTSFPLPGQVPRRAGVARLVGCDPQCAEISGHHPAAPGRRGAGHVRHRHPAGRGDGALVRNIVLFSVLIYELVGPALTKMALTASGDIQPKSDEVVNRRARKLAAENHESTFFRLSDGHQARAAGADRAAAAGL